MVRFLPSSRDRKTIIYQGKKVTVEARVLKSGETAYYRGGKRVRTQYQRRFVTGVLSGKSPRVAVGKGGEDYKKNFSNKALKADELSYSHEGARTATGAQVGLEKWGATFDSAKKGEASTYYADVEVTKKSMREVGSPTGDDDSETQVVTVQLIRRKPNGDIQNTFTEKEIRYGFRGIVGDTFNKNRLRFANDSMEEDVIRFWRHKDR